MRYASKKFRDTVKSLLLGMMGFSALMLAAGILIPMFATPFIDGPFQSCIFRKKSLATSIAIYATDNDDRLPVDRASQYGAVGWGERIRPYARDPLTFACPVDEKNLLPAGLTPVSYAMNLNLVEVDKVEATANAERIVMLFEVSGGAQRTSGAGQMTPAGSGATGDLYDNAGACGKDLYYATGNLSNSRQVGAKPRHGSKMSVAFLDLHVKYMIPESISAGRSALSPRHIENPVGLVPRAEGTEVGWHSATFSVK